MTAREEFVYRLIEGADWRAAQSDALAPLRDIDRKDGYIHLCTRDQLIETANIHLVDAQELFALEFPADSFGDALKWEASRGGALFPHLYADLPLSMMIRALKLEKSAEGFAFEADA